MSKPQSNYKPLGLHQLGAVPQPQATHPWTPPSRNSQSPSRTVASRVGKPPIGLPGDKQGPSCSGLAVRAWDRGKESQNLASTDQGDRWCSPGNRGAKPGCKTLASVRSGAKSLLPRLLHFQAWPANSSFPFHQPYLTSLVGMPLPANCYSPLSQLLQESFQDPPNPYPSTTASDAGWCILCLQEAQHLLDE